MALVRASLTIVGAASCVLGGLLSQASAQVMPFPNGNLNAQQLQTMMYMQALSGRGRGQIRTGYPQNIPWGDPFAGADTDMSNQQPDATRQDTIQKRADARKAREDQKRAARDEAKAKKAKALKDKKAKGKDVAQVSKKPKIDAASNDGN